MKVISAYLLAVVGGNASPSADDVNAILSSVGITLDGEASSQLDSLISEFEGKSAQQVIAAGMEKIGKCPGGGAGGSSGAAAANTSAADAGGDAPKEEAKKSSSEDFGGGAGMFEDDY
eukprot:TRINITY_DN656_c0_g1_i11.p2 TRINITY_DN656_c0_g1~~TRINITY_DN656_c0_g1_i11.p2  ORF type:complete len:118 (+),score=47.78 TRINITY_DN656_c0_g1_i11:159-512(+)